MNEISLSRIDGFLASSAIKLFASHGVSLAALTSQEADIKDSFISTIGFTAPRIRGVLLLTLCRDLATRSLPSNLKKTQLSDEILADWTGELSNQMLGGLKNRFHAVGVDIALSTPIVFVGKDVRHFSNALPMSRRLRLEGDGVLFVEFQADFDKGLEIGEDVAESEKTPPEGEVLFF